MCILPFTRNLPCSSRRKTLSAEPAPPGIRSRCVLRHRPAIYISQVQHKCTTCVSRLQARDHSASVKKAEAANLVRERTSYAINVGTERAFGPEILSKALPCKEAAVDASSQNLLAEVPHFAGLAHPHTPVQPRMQTSQLLVPCLHCHKTSACAPGLKCQLEGSSISLHGRGCVTVCIEIRIAGYKFISTCLHSPALQHVLQLCEFLWVIKLGHQRDQGLAHFSSLPLTLHLFFFLTLLILLGRPALTSARYGR